MTTKRIAFHTLGCKLNFAETSGMARDFETEYEVVDFRDTADYYVVQSCAVTAVAEKKCRAAIRQAHRRNPHASVIVLGCMSQLKAEELVSMDGVSMVIGNSDKHKLKDFLSDGSLDAIDKVAVSNILKTKKFQSAFSGSDRTRSFVKIQDGCDYFCSFCTIPFARGRSRSNSVMETMQLINRVVNEAPREIILTGVNIGDFGKPGSETLFDLLNEIELSDMNTRIRLSSIEPDLLTEEIIGLVAASKKLMPHFHIPLQSGSDSVLERMNRKYNTKLFTNRVNAIKRQLPHACIAADLIVGFPGETESEFLQTFELIKSLPLSYLHVFPYSERPGTRAAGFTGKLKPETIRTRTAMLSSLSQEKKSAFLLENQGRTEEVLFESENSEGFISGFTRNYIRVKAPFNYEFVNCVLKTKLVHIDSDDTFIYTADHIE